MTRQAALPSTLMESWYFPSLLPSLPHTCPHFPLPPPHTLAVKEVARRARSTSPLGDYSAPLGIIALLTRIEPMARVLVHLREWLPDLKDVTGRGIEVGGGREGGG